MFLLVPASLQLQTGIYNSCVEAPFPSNFCFNFPSHSQNNSFSWLWLVSNQTWTISVIQCTAKLAVVGTFGKHLKIMVKQPRDCDISATGYLHALLTHVIAPVMYAQHVLLVCMKKSKQNCSCVAGSESKLFPCPYGIEISLQQCHIKTIAHLMENSYKMHYQKL